MHPPTSRSGLWLLLLTPFIAAGAYLWFAQPRVPQARGPALRATRYEPPPTVATIAPGERTARGHDGITGRVLDPDGGPVVGARVCATCADCGMAVLRRHNPCALTDDDGDYALLQLPAGRHRLTASAQGFLPGVARDGQPLHVRYPGESMPGVDISLGAGGAELAGVVLDATGGAIAGATVRAIYSLAAITDPGSAAASDPQGVERSPASQQVTTDAEGHFRMWVPPGLVGVRAFTEGYVPRYLGRMAPDASVELTLTPESSISGQVLTAEGRPLAGASVRAEPTVPAPYDDLEVTTDADGRFELTGLRPGNYHLWSWAQHHHGAHMDTVVLPVATAIEDLVIVVGPAVQVAASIVSMPADRPCERGAAEMQGPGGLPLRTEVRAQGTVVFEGVPAGNYVVRVHCDEHATPDPVQLHVGAEDVEGLRWEVIRGAQLVVSVVDEAGAPVPSAQVIARSAPVPGATAVRQVGRTDARGEAHLVGLGDGTYVVSAGTTGVPTEVEVGGVDTQRVELTLPGVGTLDVEVTDTDGTPVDALLVYATDDAGTRRMAHETGAGRYRISAVPLGSYRVAASDGINPHVEAPPVQLDDGTPEVVQLTWDRADGVIRGRVVDGAGDPVADVFVDARPADADPYDVFGQQRRQLEGRRALTDPDGRFELTGLSRSARFSVFAERARGGRVEVADVAVGDEVELRMPAAVSVAGTVVGADGAPVPEFMVRISYPDSGQFEVRHIRDGEGAFQLDALNPGKLQLELVDPRSRASGTSTVDVGAGESVHDLQVVLRPMPQAGQAQGAHDEG